MYIHVYVCAPHVCLGPVEVRRDCWIPLELLLYMVGSHVCTLQQNPHPLQEYQVLLTILQPQNKYFKNITKHIIP